MVGFEVRDFKGNVTFSTEHSTWLLLKIIPINNSNINKTLTYTITAPSEDFTDIVVSIYPTSYLGPDSAATMPKVSINRVFGWQANVTVTTPAVMPNCNLVVLGR